MSLTRYPTRDTFSLSRGAKKFIKKSMKRWLRREGKRDAENAPTKKRFKGWYW
ncbi:MAG: hypothetical protein AB1631_11180 [Acidobacteriota bacterium]